VPIHPEPVNLVAIARQSVVDFINLDMEEKYPIEWNTDEALNEIDRLWMDRLHIIF